MHNDYCARLNNLRFSETADFVMSGDTGRLNESVMKGANFSRPKHLTITHLNRDELTAIADH